MGRRLKPENELTRLGKWRRTRNITHPKSHEKRKKDAKEFYKQHKKHDLDQKKIKRKQQREFVYKAMGLECMCCGELYNRNLKRTNLELHHRIYNQSPSTKAETFRQALDAYDIGGKKLLLERFALLCHTCHMSLTHIAQDIRKGRKVLEYIETEKILEL